MTNLRFRDIQGMESSSSDEDSDSGDLEEARGGGGGTGRSGVATIKLEAAAAAGVSWSKQELAFPPLREKGIPPLELVGLYTLNSVDKTHS
jgi:hypothetical protein